MRDLDSYGCLGENDLSVYDAYAKWGTVNNRYMMMNYWTKDFKGELLENPPEGDIHWVKIEEVKDLPMQEDIKLRFDLFFEPGTFEIQTVWNEEKMLLKKCS